MLSETLKAGITLCECVREATVAEECKRKIELLRDNRNHHFNMKQVIAMMNLAGHISKEDAALDMMSEYYGGMLEMGATSFWEDFVMWDFVILSAMGGVLDRQRFWQKRYSVLRF